jgi:hypothetical protein
VDRNNYLPILPFTLYSPFFMHITHLDGLGRIVRFALLLSALLFEFLKNCINLKGQSL